MVFELKKDDRRVPVMVALLFALIFQISVGLAAAAIGDMTNYEYLRNISAAGWEGYLGTFAKVGLAITIITVLAVFLILGLTTRKISFGRMWIWVVVGWLMAYFTWWQIFNTMTDGLWIPYPPLAVLFFFLIRRYGIFGSIIGGIITFSMVFWFWVDPEFWAFFYWRFW